MNKYEMMHDAELDFKLAQKRIPAYETKSKKITFSQFIRRIMEQLAENLSLPIEKLKVCWELGIEYQQYRHMWE